MLALRSRKPEIAEFRAHEFWGDVKRELGEKYLLEHGLDFDDVYEAVIYPKHEIAFDDTVDLGVDDSGAKILGMFLPDDNVALVDRKFAKEHRSDAVYVAWHEAAGHGVYQGDFLKRHAGAIRHCMSTGYEWLMYGSDLEHEADLFTRYAAAPVPFVTAVVDRVFGRDCRLTFNEPNIYAFGDGSVCAGDRWTLAYAIAAKMQPWFGGLAPRYLSYWILAEVLRDPSSSTPECRTLWEAMADYVSLIDGLAGTTWN